MSCPGLVALAVTPGAGVTPEVRRGMEEPYPGSHATEEA
jgi:hypothetical protein